MSTDTRQALAALLPCPFCGNYDGLAVANENPHDLSGGYFIACPSCDASTGLRFACGEDPTPLLIEQWNRRAALAAQPVAGAVAEPCNLCNALTVPRNATHYDAEDLSAASVRAKLMHKLIPVEAAPAPEPSAQAVAHPSHQTVREWMPVSEALRLSDLWTAGDLDNCGQWRAAIKVLADEVRALAASPQPAEPSAQGEPVAWRPGDPIYDDAYVRGVAVGFAEDDSRRTTLLRIADRIEARASAPSTPPHAVVEAETNAWPIERAADMLTAYAELVKATGRYAEEHYIPEIENVAAELRGIAPKAAQPQEKREPWLCLLCKSDRPGHHGLLDDRVTPCPDGAPKAAQQWANVPFKPETWQPDADGFTPDLCTECGTPVRYGSRHSKCAPKAAQEPRDA